jgi:hypothetical protein
MPTAMVHGVRAAHRSGTHNVILAPNEKLASRIAIAAAYRRAALNVLRCRHQRVLDAPSLLARADEVIE